MRLPRLQRPLSAAAAACAAPAAFAADGERLLWRGPNADILAEARDDGLCVKRMPDRANAAHEIAAMRTVDGIRNCVRLRGARRRDGHAEILMTRYDRSLLDVVVDVRRGEPLPPDDVARITGDVLASVVQCHQRGIAHLDVKPDNLMQDGDATVLIDFGSAHAFEPALDAETPRPTRAASGTEEYASPEQKRDAFCPRKTDMWGVAATACALLTAQMPSEGRARLDEILPRNSALGEVLAGGLVTDPADRIAPLDALAPASGNPRQLRFNMTVYESMRAMFVSRSRELAQR